MYEITAKNGSTVRLLHELSGDSCTRLLSGKMVEEVGQIPSFEFEMPRTDPCWDGVLEDRKTIISVMNTLTGSVEFEGVLLTSSEKMTSSGKLVKSGVCEGYLGYLCDTVQMYRNYKDYTPEGFLSALLSEHNSRVTAEKRIYPGLCDIDPTNTNSKTTAYRTTLEEIKVNLIDRLGGELRVRNVGGRLVLDYLSQYGTKSKTTVELAKNMVSLEVDTDSSNIVTRLVPLGVQLDPGESAARLTISSVNKGVSYIDDAAAMARYGVIMGTAEFDDITVPANLLKAGREYLMNNNRVKKSYSAQVLDLYPLLKTGDSFRAGNTYRFVNSLMGVDEELRLIKREVDIYEPYKPKVEIGDRLEKMTDIATRTAQLIEYELPQQRLDILAAAKQTATNLINAGINGYVVVNPNEILIMDTPDKSTAKRVWRWNSGGFGYSKNGYNGTFGTAITMDGAIVADFITAGVLRGLEITNGDGTFHVDTNGHVTASAIDITGGSVRIETDSESYDVIRLDCEDWTHSFSPLEWRLKNSSIDCEVIAQAGALFFRHNDDNTAYISTESGYISAKNVAADDFLFRMEDGGAWSSLRSWANSVEQRLTDQGG